MKLIIKSGDRIIYETDSAFEVQNAINNLNILQSKKEEIRSKFASLLSKEPTVQASVASEAKSTN